MFRIITKRALNPQVTLMEVYAPRIAKKALPGQFIMLRVNERGERIPLTIADYDAARGAVTIIYQIVGKTTMLLDGLREGDAILDFAGPFGNASHLGGIQKAAVIGGGLGTAIAYPQAKALHAAGAAVDCIVGFRNKDLIILAEEVKAISDKALIMTDDGSNGNKGFVTDALQRLIAEGNRYDVVIAIGPLVMMRAVAELTRVHGVKTIVSMNPVMIDGTGMCGGCRVTVGGETKFACIDGPDFDGHLVDFDEAITRGKMYRDDEQLAAARHKCEMEGKTNA
ncbi:MAG: sulfide/dihydroorotate dehydrogenase-like FAD/NAD-binding protein [Clostridiales bacterium]|nr:sulfide/dihydroorotate dehydrogenase-like FAD/NAD-binding protein [Clostridiales bacterium]